MIQWRHLFLSGGLLLLTFILSCSGQLAILFGNGIQADNCHRWGPWGNCIWIDGRSHLTAEEDEIGAGGNETALSTEEQEEAVAELLAEAGFGIAGSGNWNKSYFEQLSAGRWGCRSHIFFKLVRHKWGAAFNNVFGYLKDLTVETKPCGMCSYQQSCGRGCRSKRKRGDKSLNRLFVAERLCDASQLDGHRQDQACSSQIQSDNSTDCSHLWPSKTVELPNVSDEMQSLIEAFDFVSCRPQDTEGGRVCRCCCHPYTPHPETFRCIPKAGFKIRSHMRID